MHYLPLVLSCFPLLLLFAAHGSTASRLVTRDDLCSESTDSVQHLAYNTKTGECGCVDDSKLGKKKYLLCAEPGHASRGTSVCNDEDGCGIDCKGDLILNTAQTDCGCPAGYIERTKYKCHLQATSLPQLRKRLDDQDSACETEDEEACPLPSGGWECLDTNSTLTSCGACPLRGGVDCTTLTGVRGSTCEEGKCKILSCSAGYAFDMEAGACAESGTADEEEEEW